MIEVPPHSPGICPVVDDSRVARKAARRMLHAPGFAMAKAADGVAAMSACRAALPWASLQDRNILVMDGLLLEDAA